MQRQRFDVPYPSLTSVMVLCGLLTGCFGARTGLVNPVVERLVFNGEPSGARGTLVMIRTDQRARVRQPVFPGLSSNDDFWPAWSPGGDALAFARWNAGSAGIFVVPMSLGRGPQTPRLVVRNREVNRLDKQISWSRSGKLAYQEAGDIWIIPASAAPGTAPTRVALPPGMTARQASWSWNDRLVFAAVNAAGLSILHVMERDGTVRSLGVEGEEPDWSAHADAIVFSRGGNVIHRSMVNGSEYVVATNGREPIFGPDGRLIAFVRDGRIWVCDLLGNNQLPVTDGPNDRHPTWARLHF